MDQSAILATEISPCVDEPNAIYLELFGCCVELGQRDIVDPRQSRVSGHTLLAGQDKLALSGIRLASPRHRYLSPFIVSAQFGVSKTGLA